MRKDRRWLPRLTWAVLLAQTLAFTARADDASGTSAAAIGALIERLGLQESAVPVREMPGWRTPRKVLVCEGSPITRGRLEAAGCEVLAYQGDELSHNRAGGPTCLTRPILRDMDGVA